MAAGELQDLVDFSFSCKLQDEGYATKVFERATELYVQEYFTKYLGNPQCHKHYPYYLSY